MASKLDFVRMQREAAIRTCDDLRYRIEALEQDLKAVLRREDDANRAAMKHLRALEQERIKSKNYADFNHEWRRRCEALERQVKAADALADGRPCPTDVWLAAAVEQFDDHYDLRQAIKEWLEGDWDAAMECIDLPVAYRAAKEGGA